MQHKFMQDSLESAIEFFKVLENQKRKKILESCLEGNLLPEQISKILNNSVMATKKHLHILQESGLVEKTENSGFTTTQLGYGCIQNMDSFEFLNRHKNYFVDHTFGDIPSELLRMIGNLKNCEFHYGFYLMLPRWSEIITQAKEYLNLVFFNPPIIIADSIKPRVDSGLKVRLLVGKNSNITECNEFVKNLELCNPHPDSNVEKRRCGEVQVSLIMSESEACVIFPNNNGITDMHGNFISRDPDFVSWCHDFFEYKWDDGKIISKLR